MKHNNYLIMSVIALGLLLFARDVSAQTVSTQKDGFEKMTFNIAFDKSSYFQLEPITVSCKFANTTDNPQAAHIPYFKTQSSLDVYFKGKKKQFNSITSFSVLMASGSPLIFKPGDRYEDEITLDTSLDEFFPQPGTYMIQLSLTGSEGKLIQSNSLEIIIKEPKGIDKEAFDFIQQNKAHNRYPILFVWNNDIKCKDGKILLEEFVSKYSESLYGEYAIYQLGNYYFRNHEPEKAKIELEKLKFSNNPRIAKEAGATLSDVEKNIRAKENEKPQ